MAEYKNASISWVAQAITANVGGSEQTVQLPPFSADVEPDTEGRLDVFIIRHGVGQEWEYWATISQSDRNTVIDPGVESWNQLCIAQVEFKRTPYTVELNNSDHSSNVDYTNKVLYHHPDLTVDERNLNPNKEAYEALTKKSEE